MCMAICGVLVPPGSLSENNYLDESCLVQSLYQACHLYKDTLLLAYRALLLVLGS